jgi:di/tripeptidase
MKELTKQGVKFTAKQLADRYGCDKDTSHRHANVLFGPGEERKTRYFNEKQATAILESIKKPTSSGRKSTAELKSAVIETAQSLDFQLAIIERQAHELWKRKALEQEQRAISAEQQLQATQTLLTEGETGLEVIRRIAEARGLVMTDRDDMASAYRGGHDSPFILVFRRVPYCGFDWFHNMPPI